MKAILQWVLKTMMKDKTGVVQTLPNKDLVDFNVAMTAERLMRNGIDPNSLKNANQVENAINQIEAPRNVQQGIKSTKSAKVFDLEGKEIKNTKNIMGGKEIDLPDDVDPRDTILPSSMIDDLPPPGSRGGPDDIAAPIQSADESLRDMTEAEIKKKLEKGNKEGIARIRARQKMIEEAIDNVSPGFSGDLRVDADLVAEEMATRMGKVYDDLPDLEGTRLYGEAYDALSKKRFESKLDPEDFAQGGRAGFKDGMTRRTFLKLLGGMAAVPIVGKFFKLAKVGQKVKQVPIIKTDDVAGKPEWFDALVNKVIREGDDVTKRFATGERQSIHQKTLDDGSVVRVTEDVDDGAVRVEYESDKNVFEDPVQLQYKKPLPDEGDPRPTAEFTTAESGPVGRRSGPDDFDIEVDEVGGTSIRDLDSDVSKLKEYATGKKPTMTEFIKNKKRRDKAKAITEGGDEMIDAVTRRQGDYVPEPDDFASGGIARLLGE